MRLFLRKQSRLCSEKDISNLFNNGKSVFCYPLKLVFLESNKKSIGPQALFSVPKKYFKKANTRNQIRRRIKEAYRINRSENFMTADLLLAFIYVSKEELDYISIESAVKELFSKIDDAIIKKETKDVGG